MRDIIADSGVSNKPECINPRYLNQKTMCAKNVGGGNLETKSKMSTADLLV